MGGRRSTCVGRHLHSDPLLRGRRVRRADSHRAHGAVHAPSPHGPPAAAAVRAAVRGAAAVAPPEPATEGSVGVTGRERALLYRSPARHSLGIILWDYRCGVYVCGPW